MIEYDKKLHFVVCFAIAFALYPIIGWLGIGTSLATGIGKELYDYYDYGKFSWSDILADVAGIIVAILTIILIKAL